MPELKHESPMPWAVTVGYLVAADTDATPTHATAARARKASCWDAMVREECSGFRLWRLATSKD